MWCGAARRCPVADMERWLLTVLLHLLAVVVVQGRVQQIDVTGMVGDVVRLPCEIDETKCGEVHNIQWYRGDGDTRVFIYSELADVDTSENMLQGRGYFDYTKGSSLTELEIRELRADDESLYKCELTYLEVRDDCAVIQFVNLTTLAKPEGVRILLDDGTEVQHGSTIGPYEEDSQLVLRCESAGGKPAASVTWWNGTVNMGGDAGAIMSEDGTGLGTNTVRVPLTRHDLASQFECQATNAAVEYPLRKKVYLDLHVRPRTIELVGLEAPVEEGTTVTLTCKVMGARPAANITWLRGGQELQEQTSNTDNIQPDQTTETISRYTFAAERHLNGEHIVCVASNSVIENKAESPLRAPVEVEVLYAPVVTVSADVTTVNESMDILLLCSYDANPSDLTAVIWHKDDRPLDVTDEDHFEGGTPDQPSLLIKNASRHDAGRYRCEVANRIGGGVADNEAVVHVHFPPDVVLTMSADVVLEADVENVTFSCQVEAGDPGQLQRVKWFLDGDQLMETVRCNASDTESEFENPEDGIIASEDRDNCTIKPDQLVFLRVDGSFLANYSCSGLNSAGWGPVSKPKELIIHYPPKTAVLLYEPLTVLKGSAVTLTCRVDNLGYPPARKFIWMRGNHVITDVTGDTWRISTVSLDDNGNFSCVATNRAGNSAEGHVALDVLTKPQFIERLPPYLGALMNASSLSVTCRVECSPMCRLEWLRDDQLIEDSRHYSIKTGHIGPDARTNDFESVVSTLTWNMSAWPGHMLDRVTDNANYTCRSTANRAGPGVSSTTRFTVEYPPENITTSLEIVDVVEGETPTTVRCTADAYPVVTYLWKYDDVAIQTGDQLRLDVSDGVTRADAGDYVCHAQNRHGELATPVFLSVMYTPECTLRQTAEDGEYLLVCAVEAVPSDVTFTWRFDNETLTDRIRTEGRVSTLIVRPGSRDFGTYSCLVNNTVGAGVPCLIDVAGVSGWGVHLADSTLFVVIAVVAGAILLLLIICLTVICCRRKRAKDKLGDPSKTKSSPNGAGAPDDRAVYENLPFHGMQQPPPKPLGPWSDMEYADVDYKSYGPIDYKQESQRILSQKRSDQATPQPAAPARPPKVSSV